MSETSGTQKDFFISYARADRQWAEWVAWQLEEAKYSVIIQEWDLSADSNFIHYMNTSVEDAERTIAVLSPDYFTSQLVYGEWAVAFHHDPKGEQGFLIPIRVRRCDLEGLLGQIVYVDFVDQSEQGAQKALLMVFPPILRQWL
jgi:hypothetical protein